MGRLSLHRTAAQNCLTNTYIHCPRGLFIDQCNADAALTPGLNTLLTGFPTTKAYALCTFAYSAGPGSEPIIFEGRTDGHIVPARGPNKFGWDPIFEPVEGEGRTYAEMDGEAKNKISHRYRALEKLRVYLSEQAAKA